MFGLGFSEMLIVMLVALVAIGPKKLPGVAKAMGRGVAEFRSALDEMRSTVYKEVQQPIQQAINQHPELKETSSEYLDRLLAEREKSRTPNTPHEEAAQAEVAAKADAIYAVAAAESTPDAVKVEEGKVEEAKDSEGPKAGDS